MRLGNNPAFIKITAVFLLLITATANAQLGDSYKLNGDLVLGGDVTRYKISPDGKYVVYLADQDFDEVFDLYSVPIGGGQPVRLRQPFLFGGRFMDFQISPDSSRVVYRERVNTDAFGGFTIDLFSVPIEGGFARDISVAGPQRGVLEYEISKDSSRVVFIANRDNEASRELYSVPLSGGEVVKLNPAFNDGEQINFFDISPDSERIVYSADQDTNGVSEAYSVDIDEANSVKLNANLPSGGSVSNFFWGQNGDRIVYYADQDTVGTFELYSVPIPRNGTVPTKLNGLGEFVTGVHIAEDNENVVYSSFTLADRTGNLNIVPIIGGIPRKLNVNINGAVSLTRLSKDSQRIVFVSTAPTGVEELYSVTTSGGMPVKLNTDLVSGGFFSDVLISPDSQQVVYLAAQNPLATEVFSTHIIGGSPVRLNSLLSPDESVDNGSLKIIGEGDDTRVIYSTTTGDGNGFDPVLTEVFLTAITGNSDVVKINSDLPNDADGVRGLLTSPDNELAIYLADQNTSGQFELFVRELFDAPDEEFCVPIKAKNGKLAVICL